MKTIGYDEASTIFSTPNKIYKVYNNIELSGNTLNIPSGCTLDIQGGIFSNGTIVGHDTVVIKESNAEAFSAVTRTGTWQSGDEADVPYVEGSYNGMGRVVLKKHYDSQNPGYDKQPMLYQTDFTSENTVYVVRHDFTLGENITIPANSILCFDGGSIAASGNNDTITGNNTIIKADAIKIFSSDVTISGTWNMNEVYPEWFGKASSSSENDSVYITKAISFGKTIKFGAKTYYINSTIELPKLNFIGAGANATVFEVNRTVDFLYLKYDATWESAVTTAIISNFFVKNQSFETLNNTIIKTDASTTIGSAYYRNLIIRDIEVFGVGRFVKLSDIFRCYVYNIGLWNVVNPICIEGQCIQCTFTRITANCDLTNREDTTITSFNYFGLICTSHSYSGGASRGPESIKIHDCCFVHYDGGADINNQDGLFIVCDRLDLDACRLFGVQLSGHIIFKNSWVAGSTSNDISSDYIAIKILIPAVDMDMNCVVSCNEISMLGTPQNNNTLGIKIGFSWEDGDLINLPSYGHIIENNYFRNNGGSFKTAIKCFHLYGLNINGNRFDTGCCENAFYFHNVQPGTCIMNNYSISAIPATVTDNSSGNAIIQNNTGITIS